MNDLVLTVRLECSPTVEALALRLLAALWQRVPDVARPAPETPPAAGPEPEPAPPPETEPIAPEPVPASVDADRAVSPWTDERRALLRRDFPAGVQIDEIERRLAALPGAPLPSRAAIGVYAASTIKVRRPAGFMSTRSRAPENRRLAPQPTAVASPAEPVLAPAGGPTRGRTRDGSISVAETELDATAADAEVAAVSWLTAFRWAQQEQVALPCDGGRAAQLAAINACRAGYKLLPFAIRQHVLDGVAEVA